MASNPDFGNMTIEDLSIWLEQQGIPSEFCEKFAGVFNILFLCVPVFKRAFNFLSCVPVFISAFVSTQTTI